MVSPRVRPNNSSIPATSLFRSSDFGVSGWRRENASKRWVSVAARPAARVAASIRRSPSAPAVCRQPAPEPLETAQNHLQQVVEVVRHAAGELADRLHLLRLAQRFLDLFALLDLRLQRLVGRGQLLGAASQFLIDAALRKVGHAQHRDHDRGHRHQQPDHTVALQAHRVRLGDAAQINRAQRGAALRSRARRPPAGHRRSAARWGAAVGGSAMSVAAR